MFYERAFAMIELPHMEVTRIQVFDYYKETSTASKSERHSSSVIDPSPSPSDEPSCVEVLYRQQTYDAAIDVSKLHCCLL